MARDTQPPHGRDTKPRRDAAAAAPAPVQDSRFARLHSDPRFQRFPSVKSKVKVDERFKGMFDDKEFRVAPRVDKYGRKLKGKGEADLINKFYDLEEDEEAASESDDEALLALHADADAAGAKPQPADKAKPRKKYVDRSRGIGVSDESSSSSEEESEGGSDGSDDEGNEEGVLAQWLDGDAMAADRDGGDGGDDDGDAEPTRRLAVLNCDWDNVTAGDLYVLLASFVPAGGQVLSVVVYPSQFGRERMALEATHGPALGSAPVPVERAAVEAMEARGKAGRKRERERQAADYDEQKLREYELSKLRYYYAVAEFDSARSAAAVLAECAGAEVEASSMVVECRYVPDEMDFDEETPLLRDRATEAPPNYTAPAFATKALQQSKVQLTWDAEDTTRTRVLRRDFSTGKGKEQLREDDFKAYLASSSDDDDDDADADADGGAAAGARRREAYAALLGHARAEEADERGGGKRAAAGKGAKPAREGDVEITFLPQLEHALAAGGARARAEETVWETRQRQRREKRLQARAERKGGGGAGAGGVPAAASGEFDHYDDDDDDGGGDGGDDDGAGMGGGMGGAAAIAGDDFFARAQSDDEDGGGRRAGKAEGKGSKARKGKGKRAPADEAQTPAERAAAAKRKAELELLMLGGGGGFELGSGEERHYDLKALLKQAKGSKPKRGKAKRARGGADADDGAEQLGGDFAVDTVDPRFAALRESAEFALDPTDAKYRKTLGMEALRKSLADPKGKRGGTVERKPAPSAAAPAAPAADADSLADVAKRFMKKQKVAGAARSGGARP